MPPLGRDWRSSSEDTFFTSKLTWTICFSCLTFFTLAIAGIWGSSAEASPTLFLLLFLGAAYSLLTFTFISVMRDPPKRGASRQQRAGKGFAWTMLAFFPPPGLRLRVALTGAAALAFNNPRAGREGWLVAVALAIGAITVLGAGLMRRLDARSGIGIPEVGFLGGSIAMSMAGIVWASAMPSGPAWRWVVVLAALTAAHAQHIRELASPSEPALRPAPEPPPALDISGYALKVTRKAPVKTDPLPEGVEAQFVGSGSFKVDEARMLDKLRRYQLPDPRDFLCAWLRCAAASGASTIRLETSWTGLALTFDGRAFTAGELSQTSVMRSKLLDEGLDLLKAKA